ncbi:hypothetical protein [Halorussus caseinilyticus]|uniref:Uncharacterized protein n=1 Tax=Halorussus caseinilyticus TaxID=3034025 RepID=A0ABD5WFX1_9EURY|nr:hypothetical protein [Halorussus sp. DT72]
MVPTTSAVKFEITYAENFRQRVCDENDSDPFGHLKTKIDGEYLIGTDDTYVGVWLSEDLARLLAQTEAIVSGSETRVTFRNGPSYLVAEPYDETVDLTHCLHLEGAENPEERWEMERTFTVTKQEWITELVQASEEYYRDVLKLNPDLKKDDYLLRLGEELEAAKERLDVLSNQ